MDTKPDDPYHRLNYRRLIAWPTRIQREAPFLATHLPPAPARVVDLGCGTGEHARFLHEQGYDVLGVDRSDSQIESAREYEVEGLRFVEGDLTNPTLDLGSVFAGALCLGNVLPSFEDDALDALLANLSRWLAPSGVLVFQILNYTRLRQQQVRHLPINVRADEAQGGEIVFVRLMDYVDDTHVRFLPTTLRIPPGEDGVELRGARSVVLRSWEQADLAERFAAHGFQGIQWFGAIDGSAFDAANSSDLIGVVRR